MLREVADHVFRKGGSLFVELVRLAKAGACTFMILS